MSTQLILYPQNYKGQQGSGLSTITNEFVVDGINFTSINAAQSVDISYGGSFPPNAVLNSLAPLPSNTWHRFRTTLSGTPSLPVQTNNNLVLNSAASSTSCGVYQRLGNLVVGAVYNVTINIDVDLTDTTGKVWFHSLQYPTVGPAVFTPNFSYANVSQFTTQFTAQTVNDVVMIWYQGSGKNLTIVDISVSQTVVVPSGVYRELEDGQVICDLYAEEDIPLTLSIDDFKNVAEKVQSYSKDFDLPATKRNNQIFNNMFEITRADDGLIFNPYVKTKCVLKQHGFILFEGYLRLINIKDKNGEISYNVNLYSEVVALKDILENMTFAQLDFSELAHDYDKDSIKNSWYEPSSGTGLPLLNPLSTSSFAYDTTNQPAYGASQTNVLKYPFIDWEHQYIVGGTNPLNNSATAGFPELTDLAQAFRPCIQLKYLINKIFAAAGFTWTSNFFDSALFGEMFMDFNWGDGMSPNNYQSGGEGESAVNLYLTGTFQTAIFPTNNYPPQMSYAAGVWTVLHDNQYVHLFQNLVFTGIDVLSPSFNVEMRWVHTSGATVTYFEQASYQSTSIAFNWYVSNGWNTNGMTILSGDTFHVEVRETEQNVGASSRLEAGSNVSGFSMTSEIADEILLDTLRGDLGQWEFLKGIMTMFNLVTMVDDTNKDNILIEPYSDVFIKNTNSGNKTNLSLAARSIEHDWTDKIDVSQMELKPLTDLNEITTFKFVEDDDDYVANVVKMANSGHLYGSLDFLASTSTNGLPTVLSGTKEISAEPFATSVVKPIMAQFQGLITPSVYAMDESGICEGFENSPRIYYNNGRVDSGITYYMPKQNGLSSENQEYYLQFSHLSSVPAVSAGTRDFVFDSLNLMPGVGVPPVSNLYTEYWQPYFNELYNPDTRIMTLKVNLSPADINTFKFYDTVFIKNRVFRVNKIQYKPNSLATVEFILIP